MKLKTESGLSHGLSNIKELSLMVIILARGLTFGTLLFLFCGIGFFISAASYDVSIFGELIGVMAAVCSLLYAIDVITNHFNVYKAVIAAGFLIATGSYLIDGFDEWTVSILTHLSIIVFTLIGVTHAEETSDKKTNQEAQSKKASDKEA